jgi:DNA-directed RNA polymerase specialized sigma24 family protein
VTSSIFWYNHETKKDMTETALLIGLQMKTETAIYEVYTSYYPSVEKYILMNSGSAQDAEDIFQDAVMVLLNYVGRENFVLTSSIKTLLFAIGRRLWLKQLRYLSRMETLNEIEIEQADFVTHWEEVENSERKYDSIPQVLSRISVHCSGLLKQLFLTGKIPEHYKNNHSMRNQKYKCLEQEK